MTAPYYQGQFIIPDLPTQSPYGWLPGQAATTPPASVPAARQQPAPVTYTPPATTATPPAGAARGTMSAYDVIKAQLHSWGLDSLATNVQDMLTAGEDANIIPYRLRETPDYKTRFAGNEARIKQGLAPLSEAEYLATEAQLKGVVRRYVGSGSYDTQDQLTKWIAGDVSPQELNNRFGEYQQKYQNSPQWVRDQWAAHGFTPADAIKAVADPTVSETDLKRNLAAYSISNEQLQAYGPNSAAFDFGRMGQLANEGVTQDQARKAFGEVAARGANDQMLARLNNQQLTNTDEENELLLGDGKAAQKRTQAYQAEEARFKGNYLGATQTALSNNASGQY